MTCSSTSGGSLGGRQLLRFLTPALLLSMGNIWIVTDLHASSAVTNSTAHQVEEYLWLPSLIPEPLAQPTDATHHFPREPRPRPPLESIVQGWNVSGDASWLLNVAVIGFPKCGTSTLMQHLESHPEVQMFTKERCELSGRQEATLIRDLYRQMPAGDFVRGIKCPLDIDSTTMFLPAYQKYFPKAHFIVGVRHPVLWFESFYNFRVHNGFPMPPANKCIGACSKGVFNACTDRSNFHFFLGNLGKTNTSDPEEIKLIPPRWRRKRTVVDLPQKVFLYELSQLSDTNETREEWFLRDLQNFLHLRQAIPPMIWIRPGKNLTTDLKEQRDARKIDICDTGHNVLRHRLMENSLAASEWIERYFMKAKDVVVSNTNHFHELMERWKADPCVERRANRIGSE
ncbi:predicted protein [Phaeodactylum tricornutum CCAP 1055/1]|uniref:Uncharacterized protein n=1 Tax=Phaeodactylum tricornutum (strain CCAP 1055/1) TaxID=556484 RepID=B7G3K1_PHATC|nr:predicted protein [Phaeodactylum tricornutum CCAP 1055/1]EEC47017.1 predicted protein [Phaeodactylum tricornutum CCAP 1055/1]|eukprot:XP_002181803.1 predicted protein [Phaeodactylum tricornutum CCAP 1055/1]